MSSMIAVHERFDALSLPDNYLQPLWYAVYTRANHEKRVQRQLEQSSVESFLPLYEECRRWKDRRMRLQLPLFPGYVFVHLALRDRLKVLRIPGRSEEHTSELQSQSNLVCRLLLEKKKQRIADC